MKYVILTGIERSGSSFAVDVFHNYSNVVFLNEPPLEYLPHSPERIHEYLEGYRKRILSGFPVQGIFKPESSELTWDTLKGPTESRTFMATYDNEDFIFGIKALTPLLRHIYTLKQFADSIKIIALVRHPVDTIFSQLRYGGVDMAQPLNPTPQIKDLMDWISSNSNPLARAALTWKFNTSLILDNLDAIQVVRYSSLVADPHRVAQLVLDPSKMGAQKRQISPSEPIRYKDEFTVAGRALIARYCRYNAVELGVWD